MLLTTISREKRRFKQPYARVHGWLSKLHFFSCEIYTPPTPPPLPYTYYHLSPPYTPRSTTYSHLTPPTTIWHHLAPPSPPPTTSHNVPSHLPPPVTTSHHLSPPATTSYHHLTPPDVTWHHVPPCTITCHHLAPPTTTCVCEDSQRVCTHDRKIGLGSVAGGTGRTGHTPHTVVRHEPARHTHSICTRQGRMFNYGSAV